MSSIFLKKLNYFYKKIKNYLNKGFLKNKNSLKYY